MLTLKEYSIQEGKKALQYHNNNDKELKLIAEGEKIGLTYIYYYLHIYLKDFTLTTEDIIRLNKEIEVLNNNPSIII